RPGAAGRSAAAADVEGAPAPRAAARRPARAAGDLGGEVDAARPLDLDGAQAALVGDQARVDLVHRHVAEAAQEASERGARDRPAGQLADLARDLDLDLVDADAARQDLRQQRAELAAELEPGRDARQELRTHRGQVDGV